MGGGMNRGKRIRDSLDFLGGSFMRHFKLVLGCIKLSGLEHLKLFQQGGGGHAEMHLCID